MLEAGCQRSQTIVIDVPCMHQSCNMHAQIDGRSAFQRRDSLTAANPLIPRVCRNAAGHCSTSASMHGTRETQ